MFETDTNDLKLWHKCVLDFNGWNIKHERTTEMCLFVFNTNLIMSSL